MNMLAIPHPFASIDRFTAWVERQLNEITPNRQCEAHVCAAANGYRMYPPCDRLATVSDIGTELSFCPADYRKWLKGDFDAFK